MPPLLEGARGEGAPRPGDEGLTLLFAQAPAVPPERLIALADGPLVVWRSPDPEADGRVWSIVGWGEAARVDATGPGRFADIRERAAAIFAGARDRSRAIGAPSRAALEASARLSMRLFGGIAFQVDGRARGAAFGGASGDAPAPPWSAFQDASFTLPRWLYAVSGDTAILRLAARGDREGEGARRLTSMRRAIEAIAEASPGVELDVPSRGASLSEGALRDRGAEDRASTNPAAWSAMVLDALERIRAGELRKVVPAAVRRVSLARPADAASVIGALRAAYPECHLFAFQRGAGTFVGASPERLVGLRGLCVHADALAGTIRRGAEDDAALAEALTVSDKDLREHAHVVEAISGALRPLCKALYVPDRPSVRSLRNVHHLHTPITGELARPGHVLDLVELLHPTPAVCGAPKEAALAWITSREAAPRGWYAGAVGWLDEAGDGVFSVAIRSGLLVDREAWLYAGAGIVEGSDPALEYAETRVKQAPMLAALGVLSA